MYFSVKIILHVIYCKILLQNNNDEYNNHVLSIMLSIFHILQCIFIAESEVLKYLIKELQKLFNHQISEYLITRNIMFHIAKNVETGEWGSSYNVSGYEQKMLKPCLLTHVHAHTHISGSNAAGAKIPG